MSRVTSKNISVVLYDGAVSPASITAGPGPGDYSIGEIEAGGYEAFVAVDRGSNEAWVEGADRLVDFSITIEQTKTDPLDVAQWLSQAGDYTSLVSVNDDTDVFTCNAEVLIGETKVLHLLNLRARVTASEAGAGAPATLAITGQALTVGYGPIPA